MYVDLERSKNQADGRLNFKPSDGTRSRYRNVAKHASEEHLHQVGVPVKKPAYEDGSFCFLL